MRAAFCMDPGPIPQLLATQVALRTHVGTFKLALSVAGMQQSMGCAELQLQWAHQCCRLHGEPCSTWLEQMGQSQVSSASAYTTCAPSHQEKQHAAAATAMLISTFTRTHDNSHERCAT